MNPSHAQDDLTTEKHLAEVNTYREENKSCDAVKCLSRPAMRHIIRKESVKLMTPHAKPKYSLPAVMAVST